MDFPALMEQSFYKITKESLGSIATFTENN